MSIELKTGAGSAFWLVLLLGALLVGLWVAPASAVCVPFPCQDCWLAWQGQQNLVVMNRDRGTITLIPNIRFTGEAADFALVVPTPSIPELNPAPSEMWDEALVLTQSVSRRRSGDFTFGCEQVDFTTAAERPASDGITIHGRETVGQFEATILSSDDPDTLVAWLAANGFAIEPADAARFESYIARDWFFTAMRPDTTQTRNQMPAGGWDADVDPVAFSYAATEFELPLPVLTINGASRLSLVFYVIDDHRMTFPLFDTIYANRVSESEYMAIARQYPALATVLAPGRFLTRLDRTVITSPIIADPVLLERAPADDEFRTTSGWGGIPVPLVILGIGMGLSHRRLVRRAR